MPAVWNHTPEISESLGSTEPKPSTVGEQQALPASPSPSSGRSSSPCPRPPASRTRGPPSGRPRRRPESEPSPRRDQQMRTRRGRGHTRAPPHRHAFNPECSPAFPRGGSLSQLGPGEPHLHGHLLGVVVEACLHQAEGKHSVQIPEDKVVKNTLRRYASVGPLVRLCTCREEYVASSGAARG